VYCDHACREEQTATHLMGALLAQLINLIASDRSITTKLHKRLTRRKFLDLNACVEYIQRISTLGLFSSIRLGADGLDELLPNHRKAFLKALGSLSTEGNIQFLFFGRDHAGIQHDLSDSFESFTCCEIPRDRVANDRWLFLEHCFAQSQDWSTLDVSTKDMIFDQLTGADSL
jgi:hypothetical protein